MIYDCHLHTCFSGDSKASVRSQVERAISLGMKEICFTDHHDHDSWFCEDNFELDIPAYLKAMKTYQKKYKDRIRINIGIELGLQDHLGAHFERFDEVFRDSFDFVIGSSHFVSCMDPYYPSYWEHHGEREGITSFLEASLARAKAFYPYFDSFGHLDYVVRYAPHKDYAYSYEAFKDWIDPILQVLIDHGRALECNTGGLKYGLSQPNPSSSILKRYREMGGELITIGSDAHAPEHLGYGFDACQRLLRECGFRWYAVFHGRRPEMIPL